MRRAPLLLLALLALACQRADQEEHGPAPRAPAVPGGAWASAHVVQSDVGRVEAGAPCRFWADAYPGRPFAGEVDAAPGYVDPATGSAPVRLRLRDPDHLLRPGMTGAVAMESGASHDAPVVPVAAVVYDGAQPVVFVEEGDARYTPRAVQLGVVRGERVEIVAGVSPGAGVATTGP